MFYIRPLDVSFYFFILTFTMSCGLGEVGITIDPIDDLITNELGGTAVFTIVLNKIPEADVRINLESSDTTEGKVVPTSVIFTKENWSDAQTVTVTGENDLEDDGDIAYSIITAPAVSDDASYNGLNPPNITLVNRDDDIPIRVEPTTGLTTSENLDTTTFSVVLLKQPTYDVTVKAQSTNLNEGNVTPDELLFTSSNWNQKQDITIEGKDDSALDDDVDYQVILSIFSQDLNFNGIINNNVFLIIPVKNIDNEGKLLVNLIDDNITSENGRKAAAFELTLSRIPQENTTVPINMSVSSDEGSISRDQVIFDNTNWNNAQLITVTGLDDNIDDDDTEFFVTFSDVISADIKFNTLKPRPIPFINIDDDTAGITLTPQSTLQTTEAIGIGQTTSFDIVLNTVPLADVSIALNIPTDMDGSTEGTLDKSSVTFTSLNWDQPQTVTVSGENDDIDDDEQLYTIVVEPARSSDTHYNGIDLPDLTLTNIDDDEAGISVSPTSGLVTVENSMVPATFSLVLNSKPLASVNFDLAVSDDTEGRVEGAVLHTVTFSPDEWNIPKIINVTSVDDTETDGPITYLIETRLSVSNDPKYSGFNADDVSIVNNDNELDMEMNIKAGTITTTASGITGAGGGVDINVFGFTDDLNTTAVAKVPGPVIRTTQSAVDLMSIKINNTDTQDHNFVVDSLQTDATIIPAGLNLTYSFTTPNPGVYLYHDTLTGNQTKGLFGALIVDPIIAPTGIAGDRIWVISDMEVGVTSNDYTPNYFLINGKTGWGAMNDASTAINGTVGEKYQIYILNAGQFNHALHFQGNHVDILARDNVTLNPPEARHTVNVLSGSTTIVSYEMLQQGSYPMISQSVNADSSAGIYLNGIVTMINVNPAIVQ